jgi:hypothetical protein
MRFIREDRTFERTPLKKLLKLLLLEFLSSPAFLAGFLDDDYR